MEIGSFRSSPLSCKGWKKRNLELQRHLGTAHPIIFFHCSPCTCRYVDGTGHFTDCHFWAHHAALGRCQDNWSWGHPEGQSSLQRSTETWVMADTKGWCFSASNPENKSKLTTWWTLESDICVSVMWCVYAVLQTSVFHGFFTDCSLAC